MSVVGGFGSSWNVEFLNRGETLAWQLIGDLSDAGSDSDWTKVSVSTKSDDPIEWMDADSENTILVRVRSKSTAQVRGTVTAVLGCFIAHVERTMSNEYREKLGQSCLHQPSAFWSFSYGVALMYVS